MTQQRVRRVRETRTQRMSYLIGHQREHGASNALVDAFRKARTAQVLTVKQILS